MGEIKEIIRSLAEKYYHESVGIRRHLHRHPELSKMESGTMTFICEKLREMGIPFQNKIGGYGIVGMIRGKDPDSACIALRADMDALPVREATGLDFASENPGVMHACGHDVHMASLLGVARILTGIRNEFRGTVKLLFQPSEETYPGGAIRMIEEGVLRNPAPSFILGQHVFPFFPAGVAGFRSGPIMASTDEFFITVIGRGGHGAMPEKTVDPVLIASHIVVALQQIASRNSNPLVATVVTVGKFIADGRTNVIPETARLEGTVRTFDEGWRIKVHDLIRRIASHTAEAMGGSCEVKIDRGYPFLNNDTELTARVVDLSKQYLGEENVKHMEQRMGAEDFSYFAKEVPSCFYGLGTADPVTGTGPNLHTPGFDVDESSLKTGMGLMAWLAVRLLR